MISQNPRLLKLPLRVFISYLIVTLMMYYLSPWSWPKENNFLFIVFNFFILCAIIIGYKKGVKRYLRNPLLPRGDTRKLLIKYLNFSIFLNFIFIYPKILFNLKTTNLSISGAFERVLLGLSNPGFAYSLKHEADNPFNSLTNPLVLSYLCAKPFMAFMFPLAVVFWKNISLTKKSCIIFIILIDIMSYIAIGTNKGIFDYLLVLPFLAIVANPELFSKQQFNLKKILTILLCIMSLFVGMSYFAKGNHDRKENYFYYESATDSYADIDSFILKLIPSTSEKAYLSLDNYLTQGYYALDKSLGMEFKSTYGFGHSFFTTGLAEKAIGNNVVSGRTYQARLEDEYNYSHFGKWHTFYVWFANDLSFIGVIFLVYFLSRYFAMAWSGALLHKDLYSIVMLPYFILIFFYLNANNQVLGFMGSSVSFFITFILWRLQRKRFLV